MLAIAVLALASGCGAAGSPVYWHEGENYADGPAAAAEGVSEKAPASGGKCLIGRALGKTGDRVGYDLKLPADVPEAKLLLRYSRHHWKPMPPSKLDVVLTGPGAKRIARPVVLGDTKGWGSKPKQWRLAAVDVGTLGAGRWRLTLSPAVTHYSDVCIDGFFIAPGSVKITGEELSAADRIHITSSGYVGLAVGPPAVRQDACKGFGLVARGFVAGTSTAEVVLLDSAGKRAAVLRRKRRVDIAVEAGRGVVPAGPLKDLPDGAYVLRAKWRGAGAFEVPVALVGQLAELKKHGIPHELHVFADHGHPYAPYAEQYFALSLDFFEKHAPAR